MKYTIDATGKTLGRLASEVAMALMGKHSPAYRPNVKPSCDVLVTNLGKVQFTGRKTTQKLYWRFSGYPGGLKNASLGTLWEKDPVTMLAHVVSGMLPKNKLRPLMLKRLKATL